MSMNGVSLKISGLKKDWGAVNVLKGIDLEIEPGTFLTLLGPSGCGKSTALRLIAGLDSVTDGTIEIDGRNVTDTQPAERNIGMVFQNYALFPHMTVRQNILYGMKVRRDSKAEQEAGLKRVAELMNLSPLLDRHPGQLSGGQQQRVALARVLISNRPLVLMDEPLSNLDAKLRSEIRSEIRDLNRKLGLTIVYVTHDQSEALSMSDKVLLMGDGQAIQFGAPEDLFNNPANITAARFVGTPPMNVISANHLSSHISSLDLSHTVDSLMVGIRPENLTIGEQPSNMSFPATVHNTEYEGNFTLIRLKTDLGDPVTVTLPSIEAPANGTKVFVDCDPAAIRLFQASNGTALTT